MIRCLLVDDDGMARLVLERFLGTDPELTLVASCATLAEARRTLRRDAVDLLFLDDDLPDGSGLEFIRVEQPLPRTILVTGAREIAAKAAAAGAMAALTKPLALDSFREAVAKARAD